MGKYVGADWASKGWATAVLTERELSKEKGLKAEFHPTVWNLWSEHSDAEQICIDIPIGLPENEQRSCDKEARECLTERGSSVFPTPCRIAVKKNNIDDAKKAQTEGKNADYSISNQAWAIVPRIREVDTFLQEFKDEELRHDFDDEFSQRIRESHPEVCFRALNRDNPVKPKNSDGGRDRRAELLCEHLQIEASEDDEKLFENNDFEEEVEKLTEPYYARYVAEDDLIDAIVLAITAKHVDNDTAKSFPTNYEFDNPPTDDKSFPKEIVYPDPDHVRG